jgi:hypothetical protein
MPIGSMWSLVIALLLVGLWFGWLQPMGALVIAVALLTEVLPALREAQAVDRRALRHALAAVVVGALAMGLAEALPPLPLWYLP